MPSLPAVINFYSTTDQYGELSNFGGYPVEVSGRRCPTSEHYFQAMKFDDVQYRESIRTAKSPMIAARLGRSRTQKLRRDWESVKLAVMREAVLAKFTQHDELRALLLSTGEATLVEHTVNDSYWGDGGDGSGANWLGQILMETREALRVASGS